MIFQSILFAIGAYLVGSIPFGKIIADHVARIDITKRGSGNIGATNVARELGMKWGILTLVLDLMKGLAPVLLYARYSSPSGPSEDIGLALVGLGALLGHQFSIFLRFRGGKGVATALGVYLAICPLCCFCALGLFLLVVAKWDFISLGSIISGAAMPLFLALFSRPLPLVTGSLIMALFICFKHRDNIKRLLNGEETGWKNRRSQPSTSRSLSNSSSE